MIHVPTRVRTRPSSPHPTGIRRSSELLRLYRREPLDPAPFYEFLAVDTMAQLEGQGVDPRGIVVDIGGGPGYTAEAARTRGGRTIVIEYDEGELHLHGRCPVDALVGDGQALPLRTGVADIVHSSNVLEHVPNPESMLGEMQRVLRIDGVGYLSYTPWFSPWGGHETSPWHYFGGRWAAARYERRTGTRPKNEFGVSLFELHMAKVRAWFEAQADLRILWEGPRYWPPAWRSLAHLPLLGEVISWNHLIVFQKKESRPSP